jgi:hypothetical protein
MTYGIYDGSKIIAKFSAPVTLKSNVPVFASDTLSLKRFSTARPAQRWELETGLEPLTYNANELYVHLVTKGTTEEFKIITPQNFGVIASRTSSAAITATGSAGATQVNITGNSGIIPMGTMIKFANHGKIYMTKNTFSTVTGTLQIFPALRVAVSATAVSHRDDVQMSCLYDIDTVSGMVYRDGIMMDVGTIKIIEKL